MKANEKRYLDYIRSLPCVHCGNPETEPHHVIGIGAGKMGGKADHLHTIPLCRYHHDLVHGDVDAWPQFLWLILTQEQAVKDGVIQYGVRNDP